MPERPKRRKNKNKRKNNKNSNTDVNKNKIEEGETVNESCSGIVENAVKENTTRIEDDSIDIATSSVVNKSDIESDRQDTSQIAKEVKDEKDESNTEILATSEICIALDENCKTDADRENPNENENNEKALIKDSALTQQSICNVTKQAEEVPQTYIVETPEQANITNTKCKLDNTKKSKSCDSDDCPTIVEITDETNVQVETDNSLPLTDNSNAIISAKESDVEWEKVHYFNLPDPQLIKGILSSDTIPLNIVHCEQIKSLSPQEELSLRNYLQTLNLSTSPSNPNSGDIKTEIEQIINREIKYRLRKKGLIEDATFIRSGPCRSLAVIDEEGSGDSSKTSRRHSYLSDKKSDNEELEDDVFECKPSQQVRNSNIIAMTNNSNKRLIPQPCIRVDAKLKEPEISEARGDWSIKTVEKITGAELVYLTDSSSSTSSVYDLNEDADKGEDTDVPVRMITPTIEVTDTESLLSNTFLSNYNDKDSIIKPSKNTDEVVSKSTTVAGYNTKEPNQNEIGSNIQHDSHEIVILSTDDIKTNLIVKDINESSRITETKDLSKVENSSEKMKNISSKTLKDTDTYDLEIKVLKCELNNAINNLIKEVISDSENSKDSSRDTFTRQDSSSSLDSSQCTAKYNPTHSSLNDVSNILQDDTNEDTNKENAKIEATFSHVKDVIQCVTSAEPLQTTKKTEDKGHKQPPKLRDICVKKITSFPFGDKILEELAHVSLRLQNMSVLASERHHIVKDQTVDKSSQLGANYYESRKSSEIKNACYKESSIAPPPILPRKSSLKLTQDEPIVKDIPKTETKYECLSPSQKMLMEKTHTTAEKDNNSKPNVNYILTEKSNHNEKTVTRPNIPTNIAPMKSETGSRLLALLRDTSISNNLNTRTLEDTHSHQVPNLKNHSETFTKRLLNELESTNEYTETLTSNRTCSVSTRSSINYKPIPPPKPKKLSTYCYESDGGSDLRGNSFREMHCNKKYFHYSTGNLNKEIEEDISSIQNMHRYCTNLRDQSFESTPRRPSLPKDLCDQEMEYIRQKEKEVDAELQRLEMEQNKPNRNRGPRAPMISDDKNKYSSTFESKTKSYLNKDFASTSQPHKNFENNKLSSLFSSSQEELLREKMYSEYVNQMTEREQRRQQKVIKITQPPVSSSVISKSLPLLHHFDSKINNRIEQEFISKAKERWCKLGIRDPVTEDEKDIGSDVYVEPKIIEHKIKVIEAGEEKDVAKLPSHMQDFVKFTVKDKEQDSGSTGESNADKASAHVVVFCAVMILVLTVGKFLLQLLRNK